MRLHRSLVLALGTLMLTGALQLTGGCCSTGSLRPAKVGVPESMERSPDLSLPLDAASRERLREYLADPAGETDAADRGPTHFKEVDGQYREIIEWLGTRAPIRTDVQEGGELLALADDPGWVIEVHDARYDGFDLTVDNATALVKGEFVFCFFDRALERRELRRQTDIAAAAREGLPRKVSVWVLGESTDGFTGLVVFSKTYLEVPAAK